MRLYLGVCWWTKEKILPTHLSAPQPSILTHPGHIPVLGHDPVATVPTYPSVPEKASLLLSTYHRMFFSFSTSVSVCVHMFCTCVCMHMYVEVQG